VFRISGRPPCPFFTSRTNDAHAIVAACASSSEQTTVTEYFDRFSEPDGQEWFTVTTIVDDPVHLAAPFVTTTDFRREPNDGKFSPVPCSAR
jgi:hypothetical protein